MFKYIQFQYIRQDSPLHRMDAISKLLFVLIISLAVYFFNKPIQIAFMLIILLSLALFVGHIRLPIVICSFMVFIVFGLLVAFFQLVSHQKGEVIGQIFFLKITPQALYYSQIFLFRLATIGSAALLYLWSTNPREFAIGLIYLGIPYRFAFAILVALRFLPLIQSEINKIKDAHLVRGLVEKSGLKGFYEKWNRYTFPLLANGLRKSELTSIAMDSRAFGLYPTRTYIDEFHWSKSGLLLLSFTIVIIVILGYKWGFVFYQPRYNA